MTQIEISIEYDHIKGISKNTTLERSANGMFKSAAARQIHKDIWFALKGVINDTKPYPVFRQAKYWIKIMLYLSKHPRDPGKACIDPINTLDLVADVVKEAIGVDDDVAASVVDWGVDRENPRIEISIEQEVSDEVI